MSHPAKTTLGPRAACEGELALTADLALAEVICAELLQLPDSRLRRALCALRVAFWRAFHQRTGVWSCEEAVGFTRWFCALSPAAPAGALEAACRAGRAEAERCLEAARGG